MYEYLDRPPQIGDVVQWVRNTDNKHFTKDKLYIVDSLYESEEKSHPRVIRDDGTKDWAHIGHFKVIKTKPGSTAQAGDTIIRIAKGVHPIGATHTVYRNFGEGASKGNVYYENSCSIPHTDVLVLCKAQPKEQPMQITDHIVDIANSTLADRLRLRQVLLDNGQKVDSNMHTTGSNIYYMCTTWYCRSHINGHNISLAGHNISLADFINKFKKQDKLRNLAFYKRSGKPWAKDELHNIVAYVGDNPIHDSDFGEYENVKFTYDTATGTEFMVWDKGNSLPNFKNCLKVAYEDVFPTTNQKSETTQVEPTNQTTKEQPMTIQQLLQTLFGAEKPTTDYDKRPAILVVAYNRDGSQMGQAIADNMEQVKAKVADTPELWGCKVLTYTLDQEVSVKVPVKATKAEVAKPVKE